MTETTQEAYMELPDKVKKLIQKKDFNACYEIILDMMKQYPHSAIPHNCLGILMEQCEDHVCAMAHFRAAYALEPDFIPAKYNIEIYGGLARYNEPIYDMTTKSELEKIRQLKKRYRL